MPKSTQLVDAHCHLDSFGEKQLQELPAGIIPVTCGYSHKSNIKTVEIAKRLGAPFCLGIAPQTAIVEGIGSLGEWMQFIADQRPHAIGEAGLDYHWGKTKADFEKQDRVFREMIMLAGKMKLPLVVHSRKAETECLDVLEEVSWKGGFMMHFFSGSLEAASRAADMGGIISIIGLHSKARRRVIEEIPLESMVVETDAPYVTRNIDGIGLAIEYISGISGIPEQEVGEVTARNAREFFRI